MDIRRAKAVRATANVDSVNAGANSLVMLGITVSVDALTRLEDKSNADVRPLTLANINAGDYIEVRGGEFPAGSGDILATILERDDADHLKRYCRASSRRSAILPSQFLVSRFKPVAERSSATKTMRVISSTDFFNRLAPNSLVKAKGSEVSGTVISATEVEFELEF